MPGEVIAVTGHRPDKLGGWSIPNPIFNHVVANLSRALDELAPLLVLSGMALGVDQWTAELCISKNIAFTACLPMDLDAFTRRWPEHAKAKLNWILTKAHQIVVVSPGDYIPVKMQRRNIWMVDNSVRLLAAFNGTKGGTANCIGYAVSIGRPIHYIDMPVNTDLTSAKQAAPINQWIEEQARRVLVGTVPAPTVGTSRYQRPLDLGDDDS